MEKKDEHLNSPSQILKKFWNYDSFRPLQENIIQNALKGNDTLALLPTGGGKSICFQVPGLIFEGLTLVVSPLIALMKDQVEQLKKRGINASAVISGMHKHEIDIALDNCIYGHTKFLYISPERLKSELFIQRMRKMQIALVVIDEAHCISQWGYDFRPAYLEISEIRQYLNDLVPFMALTATATPEIQKDIVEKLQLRNVEVFSKSFARPNLSYSCVKTENKISSLIDQLNTIKSSGIIYVRSRKKCKSISDLLKSKGINSTFYHAGLSASERNKIQNEWIKNKYKVIVCTNAFGMGIDKPDVRLVCHLDIPDSPEAYYQEAGRAGRDEQFARAIIFYEQKDITELRSKTEARFPDLESLRHVYNSIGNHFQLALGSGEMQTYQIDLYKISSKFDIPLLKLYYSIKEMEKHGYFNFEESPNSVSTLNFTINYKEVYNFQVSHAKYDSFIKTIIRIYGGQLFSNYVQIDEDEIASKAIMRHNQVIENLNYLTEVGIMDYIPKSDQPKITYLLPRQNTHNSFLSQKQLDEDREKYFKRMNKMFEYVGLKNTCRTNFFQDYFGETKYSKCGNCDNCVKIDGKELENALLSLLEVRSKLSFDSICAHFTQYKREDIAQILRKMKLDEKVKLDDNKDIILN